MSIIATGKYFEFVITFAIFVMVIYYMASTIYRKKVYSLRKMPQVDAISEGVDRAVEQGKSVFILPGQGALDGVQGPMTIAGLNVLRYTTRLCVERGARPILCSEGYQVIPIMDGIFREVCLKAGKPEAYRMDDVRYTPQSDTSVPANMLRDSVACFVNVGPSGGGNQGVGWARELGAMCIGGTGRLVHLGTVATHYQYPMFLEDLFACSSICAGDDVVAASMWGGDIVKIGMLVVLWVGVILAIAGQPVLTWLAT